MDLSDDYLPNIDIKNKNVCDVGTYFRIYKLMAFQPPNKQLLHIWHIPLVRSNLGLEKSGWDDLQLSAYGASNEVVFSHLDEHFQDIVDIRTFSSQAWEELKEDIEGFPFNGRTLNRTNVESCLLHYLRHTSNLQLAASFSAYLRENGKFCTFYRVWFLVTYWHFLCF